MSEEKIYKGIIKELTHIGTNTFGIQTYAIGFSTGKAMLQISQKRILLVELGDSVLFTGKFLSENLFLIDNIKCVSLSYKDNSMSEQTYRRMMIRQ